MHKKLCGYDEVPDPGSKGISMLIDEIEHKVFVVKKNSKIFVYKNSCPHTFGPLDWQPDVFLDIDNDFIMCANHGALFEIDTGLCIYGPCKSQSLQPVEHEVINGDICLKI